MKDFFESTTSTQGIKFLISESSGVPTRGLAKKIADALGCHPTFVSQVTRGKAWLNNDQAIRFCRYFCLSAEETQFFLDLLNKDRSASTDAKEFFEERLQKQRKGRLDLKRRFENTHSLAPQDEARYYDSWLPQVVHMLCKCEGRNTVPAMAQSLGISQSLVNEILSDLERMGLISREGASIHCSESNVHLAKAAPVIRRLHAVWRIKTLELMGARRELTGLHYSSLFACDEKTLGNLKKLLTENLEQTRKLIIDAPAKTLGVCCVDLYPFFEGTRL